MLYVFEIIKKGGSPYLSEFQRKPQKIAVDRRDRGLNQAPPVYQFRGQNHSATGGAESLREWRRIPYCRKSVKLTENILT